jgi:hypothetical protein
VSDSSAAQTVWFCEDLSALISAAIAKLPRLMLLWDFDNPRSCGYQRLSMDMTAAWRLPALLSSSEMARLRVPSMLVWPAWSENAAACPLPVATALDQSSTTNNG